MIKVSLIVLVGLGVTALARHRSAALRHWVLASAIVCAAATPMLEQIVPAWHVTVPAMFERQIAPLPLYIPIHAIDATEDAIGIEQQSRSALDGPGRSLLGRIWAAGVGISVVLLLVGFGRLRWVASHAVELHQGRWAEFAATLSHEYGLRRRVVLLQSDHPTLLVTWGLWQPKVILPKAARDWTDARVRIVLSHELAHIRRGDWLVHMVAAVLRAIYWFNPLVWIACRRLRRESEHACDDAVMNHGVDGPDYAAHLLELARAFRQHRRSAFLGFPAPAMARPSSLERRICAMLNTRLNRSPITRPASIVTVLALFALAVPIAGAVASAQTSAATFSGSLVDAVGKMLPHVPLVLSHSTSRQKHETRSDSNGQFSFVGLPEGEYVLEAQKPGFATTQGRVTLGAGQHLQQDVALQLGSLQETINIVCDAAPAQTAAAPRARSRPWSAPPEADACGQSPVGGCITMPMKVHDVKPICPAGQREAGSSVVELEGRIGTDGFLKDLHLTAPVDAGFARATLDAVRQWQFTATRLGGVPVETPLRIHARYTVQ